MATKTYLLSTENIVESLFHKRDTFIRVRTMRIFVPLRTQSLKPPDPLTLYTTNTSMFSLRAAHGSYGGSLWRPY